MNIRSEIETKETSQQIQLMDVDPHDWISVAAYYKAEARGFESGKEMDDWLEAENEYKKVYIKSFILRCEEDGGLTIASLQGLARTIGVTRPERINSKVKLIHEIQTISQHRPCFQPGNPMFCEELQCEWRAECRKLVAAWHRQH